MFVVPEIIATTFGWVGAIAAVSAYGSVTAKRISPDSATFQILNLIGAAFLGVSAYAVGAVPSAIVNIVWITIGFFALRTIARLRRADLRTRNMTPADLFAAEWVRPERAGIDPGLHDLVSAELITVDVPNEYLTFDRNELAFAA